MKNNKHMGKFKTKQILAVMLAATVAAPSFVYGADGIDATETTDISSDISSYSANKTEEIKLMGESTESTDAVKDLRWDFVTDTEGVGVENSSTTVAFSGKDLRVTGATPQVKISGISINREKHKYLYIRMRNNSSCWQGPIYILKDGYDNILKLVYQSYNNRKNDEYIYYKIPLSDAKPDHGTIQEEYETLRLDFTNVGTGYIDIDYIVLSSEDFSGEGYFVNPNDFITQVAVGETIVDCTGTQKPQYYEADVYEDIYETLSTDDISAAIKDGTGATVSDITMKEVKDRKIVDITATSEGKAQTVRVVCKSVIRPVTLNIDSCNISRKTIKFSGSLADDKGNPLSSPVTAVAYKTGETVGKSSIKFIKNILPTADGKFECTFNINDSETTAEKYDMAIVFDAMGVTNPHKETITYLNDTYASENIGNLKQSSDDMLDFMTTVDNAVIYERLGVWLDLYNSQSGAVKEEINSFANKAKSELDEDNAAEIANASILASIAKNLSAEKLAELIEKYDTESCNMEIAKTETTTKRFSEFEPESQKNIAAKLKDNYTLSDYKTFKTALREAMLIEETSLVSYMKLKDLLLNNTDILDDDLDELSSLTDETVLDTAMGAVSTTAKQSGYTSAEALAKDVKKEIKDAKGTSGGGNGGSSGGSGGSSGGSFGLSGTPVASDNTDEVISNAEAFVDMGGYDWAKTAVEYLSDKKIVNGVGGNRFEPSATVKREEFVKMICNAFNITGSGADMNYEDVVNGEWYYSFVSAATENGIINGISDTKFGTGEDIKREDMAVIIYRTLKNLGKIAETDTAVTFEDWESISDYAREAVSTLNSAGIINGSDGNRFEPDKSASRAEAAVMIYRCMENLK